MADDKVIEVHDGEETPAESSAESPAATSSTWEWKSKFMEVLKWMRANLLLVITMAAVFLGVFFGGVLRTARPSDTAIKVIGLPGDVLLRLLKMLVLPLIVSSLITGLTSLDTKSCGKMGARALVYYFTTTCIAVILGIIVVVAIHPGRDTGRAGAQKELAETLKEDSPNSKDTDPLDTFSDILRNLFPSNLIQACFQQAKTFHSQKDTGNGSVLVDCKWDGSTRFGECDFFKNNTETTDTRTEGFKDGMNVLGILVFTIPFGILLSRMGERGRVMVDFFEILSELTMQLVNIVMWYSPLGIISLICSKMLAVENLANTMATLGLYIVTVVLGLVIHLGILMTIFYTVTRKNPLVFFEGILQAWLTAFATASSAATLPVTFRCLEENLGIDKRVTRFVLPIGTIVNMDGTALYEAVATIFIGQFANEDMHFSDIITISLTATLASIGAASIPSAGIVTLMLVLTAVGFSLDNVGLLLAVDWFLDRCRTSINVVGDSYGAGIVYHLSKKELDALDEEEAKLELEGVKEEDAINSDKPEIEDGIVVEDSEKKEGANCESGL